MAIATLNFPTPESYWQRLKDAATRVRRECQDVHDRSAAGDITWTDLDALAGTLNFALAVIAEATALSAGWRSAVQDVARADMQEPTLDLATEAVELRTACIAVLDAVDASAPKATGGWLSVQTTARDVDFLGQLKLTARTFTTAQTASLRPLLLAVVSETRIS